ncbi:hydroxymethylglutaryl-CoA reductase [Candidatus Gottesmanbacteria bacterium]|nr:hydroxymethylglutaryl-CoA reductase [Candidatus Gottesmanbacteria bacterium]
MKLQDAKTVRVRRKLLETITKKSFSSVSTYPESLEVASSHNCENMVGATSIPLGIAGPIHIRGSVAKGTFYLPLATTEGALVASINRGCKAISQSGGGIVNCHRVGITRGPVFYTGSIENSEKLYRWIKTHGDRLRKEAQETSNHLKLDKIKVNTLSQHVFVRFSFDTQDAMGMNMATIATQKMAEFLEHETGFKCLSLAGNFDIDKKAAWLNFIENRGWKVWAEVILSEKVLSSVLKTTAQKLYETWLAKCVYGSMMSGSLGFNAHFANVVAALFIATGQDVAHVVEGSLGITTTQMTKQGLYLSVYLPSLVIGTVGGGTSLPAQNEALDILGVAGGKNGKNAATLAEIVGGAVLAGEISLLASLSVGSLASSHQKFARGK